MKSSVLSHHRNKTNNELYCALDAWRFGVASRQQNEMAWYALLATVEHKASKHYNQHITENEDRAMLLGQYLTENSNKPVRLLLYNYRKLFPTFELVLELYGMDLVDQDICITKLVNKNMFYYMRQVASLQREYQCWDTERLTQLWLNETDESKRRTNDVSNYRLRTIREMSEQIITARLKQREYPESQLSAKECRLAGLN